MINQRAASSTGDDVGLNAGFLATYTMSARFNGQRRRGTGAPARQN
jgi:hypothetical protein